ncbi:carboxymuconolactone decarboxylase family protein [Dyadobacter sp. CY343]|uniref:carboxymuconolactone decarboxylase family protein n=1 Tax=Dyadobacter sp. CY343 TaxID=2907299 RepID=UPI001F2DCDE4|nr:carboxymuconolactone decarboxylase family protein [Dyadobacter sp. CY343]MCE7059355.1 carboxymuconolactone decarboxylase family protein [Dyadobacter sp. CY343]
MEKHNSVNTRLSSKVDIQYPEFTKLPELVRQKFEGLPTKVNFFRMLGYSPGAFVEVIDLTNAIFKNLTISDYHKELLVLLVGARTGCDYEWEQHVSIAQAAGVSEDQFIAIAANRIDAGEVFKERERVLLHFGNCIIEQGKAPGVIFNHTLEHFSVEELSDAMIVIGFYRMLSGYIQTFNLPADPQEDGNWVKA